MLCAVSFVALAGCHGDDITSYDVPRGEPKVRLLAGIVHAELPPAGAGPALFGVGVGFTLLFAFGLPPVLQLARVPALRVIRRELGALKPASLAVLVAGADCLSSSRRSMRPWRATERRY